MSCGYACVGCGRCTGKPRELIVTTKCFRCGHENPVGLRRCEECGMEMPRLPDAMVATLTDDEKRRYGVIA